VWKVRAVGPAAALSRLSPENFPVIVSTKYDLLGPSARQRLANGNLVAACRAVRQDSEDVRRLVEEHADELEDHDPVADAKKTIARLRRLVEENRVELDEPDRGPVFRAALAWYRAGMPEADGAYGRLVRLAREFDAWRVGAGRPIPAGHLGTAWVCSCLARYARGEGSGVGLLWANVRYFLGVC
jgi:hypothetical protein